MCRLSTMFILLLLVIVFFVVVSHIGISVSIQGSDDSRQKSISDTPTSVHRDIPTPMPTNTPTAIPTDTPTPMPTDTPTSIPTDTPTPIPTDIPTDTSSTNYDVLPDTTYYCNSVHYLGGHFPQHFYVGHCLISNVEQFSTTIPDIAKVISATLCQENVVCSGIVNGLSAFIKGRIDHIYSDDNQCGQRGVYVHLFDVFYTTHPVC